MTSPVTLPMRLRATRVTSPMTPRDVADDPIRVTHDPARNLIRNPTTAPGADAPALHLAPPPPVALIGRTVLLESV
jgi:hypothetical protein